MNERRGVAAAEARSAEPGIATATAGGRVAVVGRAVAQGRVTMQPSTAALVAANAVAKGDVLGTARYAAIQAAKDTHAYLPRCFPSLLQRVSVQFNVRHDAIEVEATVESSTPEDPSIQALTAVTVAALTIFDMCKSADRTMVIGPVSTAA